MLPKHLNHQDFIRVLENCRQQERYLDYFLDRMDFWFNVLQHETDPNWFEVAHQNFTLVADRADRLSSLLF